jgi:hypothetical protein
MLSKHELLKTGDSVRIWQKYCGFLDLTVEEFMEIQEQLLLHQIDTIYGSPITRKFMSEKPKDIREFRNSVPLTTYQDYAEFFNNKNEEALPVKPLHWVCTSGRGGTFKWIPWTENSLEVYATAGIAAAILACANNRNEVKIRKGARALVNLAPPPYGSGILSKAMAERMGVHLMPPIDDDGSVENFAEKIQLGFKNCTAKWRRFPELPYQHND